MAVATAGLLTGEQTEKPETLADLYDFRSAEAELQLEQEAVKEIEANRAFFAGDHWQDGTQWIGPHPADNAGDAQEIFERLQRGFVSKNLVKEGVNREKTAVIGHQPDYKLTPRRAMNKVVRKVTKQIPDPNFVGNPLKPEIQAPLIDDPAGEQIDDPLGIMIDEDPSQEEQTLISEANAALVAWWDKRKVLRALQEAVIRKLLHGRGYIRLFVPPKVQKAGVVPRAKTLEEALMAIYIDTPEPEDARVVIDDETMEPVSICRYKVTDRFTQEERVRLVLSALTENNETIVMTLRDDMETLSEELIGSVLEPDRPEEAETNRSEPLKLNGNLLLFELAGEQLITPQVVQANKLVNLALTMCGHNIVEAGFSERVFANAQLPGVEIPDPSRPDGKKFIPDPMPRGAGVTTALTGVSYVDEEGKTHVMDPKVYFRQPVDVSSFEKTKALGNQTALEEMHQLHAQISGDATPSGESRIQALADFVMNCLDTKEGVDTAGAWTLETALYTAAHFTGSPGKYLPLRVNFDSKIDVGKITPDEKRALMEEVSKRLRSRKSYMLLTGQADPDAEIAEIVSEGERFASIIQPQPTTGE